MTQTPPGSPSTDRPQTAQAQHTVIGHVRTLAIYPEKDAPGRLLEDARIEPTGVLGDRVKKRPVHLVGAGETPQTTRANLFLEVENEVLAELVGQEVAVGQDGCRLRITERPSGCPGVYAEVAQVGSVRVGDSLRRL